MGITERELERMLVALRNRGVLGEKEPGDPVPVVCLDCYRDGGCREHSGPDEEGDDDARRSRA